jgi:putative DNA primase/helicase
MVLSEDELHQARSISVLEIAERHGAQLKKSGREYAGPCPLCGGVDRFSVRTDKNVWNCRGCDKGGDAIDLEMHLSGSSFVNAVRALIGKDAGTTNRRQPTPEEIRARETREAERRQAQAEEQARNAGSAARIVASLQPVAGTPGEAYLRDTRKIDIDHWAVRRALEDVETLGWCERTFFRQPDPSKPGHELHGQWLGAIVAILTDPINGERTGGITRTFIRQGCKVCRAMSLGGAGRLGIIRLTSDDEVETGLHLCEGLESALSAMTMGFIPMWAVGSTSQMQNFPVLNGVGCLTVIADHDIEDKAGREAGQEAARAVCQRWADAGRKVVMKTPKRRGEDANDITKRRACA